jgi:hypothetical protein
MRLHLLLVVFVLAVSSLSLGADDQLKVRTSDGIDYVSYDPGHAQREDVLRWIQLSPNVDDANQYLVPEWLEVCVDKAPEYLRCGSRDLRDLNFFHNAEVNLQKIRNRSKRGRIRPNSSRL